MPHLQFEINKKVDGGIKRKFAKEIRNGFAEIMDTGKYHIAISIREYNKFDIDSNNQYITFTQHPGEDFHLIEKSLANWKPGEEPL